MILVDTSVWVAHFRQRIPLLEDQLLKQRIFTHASVIGELACGTLPQRPHVLQWLRHLPTLKAADDHEVLTLIEEKRLWGTGVGWVDAHLLATALIAGCELWTRDRPLHAAATKLGAAFLEHGLLQ